MNKRFLIEQCNRFRFESLDENMLHEIKDNTEWRDHNIGHLHLIEDFVNFLNLRFDSTIDKNICKKFLKKKIDLSNEIINVLDEIYYDDESPKKMCEHNEFVYHFYCGMECQALYLMSVINKLLYRDKSSYDKTDWSYITNNKEDIDV